MATHRYWRLLYLSNGGTDDYASMQEIELHDSIGGSNLTGSGTASASYYADGAAANLVDNNPGTHWGIYPQVITGTIVWWAYDFGSGNAYDIIEIAITSRATYYYESPSVFFWQYSDNGTEWYNSAFISGVDWASQTTKTVDVSVNIAPVYDSFTGADGSSVNTDRWTVTGSPDIQSNTVEITNAGTIEVLDSKHTFSGDFCVEVDFNIASPPSANSWGCDLKAYVDATHYMGIRVCRYSSAIYFQQFYYNGVTEVYNAIARTNSSGKLIVSRVGNSFRVFASEAGNNFKRVGQLVNIGTGAVTVSIQNTQWDTNPTITCRYDDYMIISPYQLESVFLATGQNWQSVGEMKINIGGNLNNVHEGWVVVDGNWKPFWPPT